VRKKRLMTVFGSVGAMRRASVDEIAAVKGMTPTLASRVKSHSAVDVTKSRPCCGQRSLRTSSASVASSRTTGRCRDFSSSKRCSTKRRAPPRSPRARTFALRLVLLSRRREAD